MRRCADRLLNRGWMALLALGIAGPAGAFPVSAPFFHTHVFCDAPADQILTHDRAGLSGG